MSLRVHALLIGEIVSPLRTIHRPIRSADARHRADAQANTGTHRGALSSTERGARCGAYGGPDHGSRCAADLGVLCGGFSTDRFKSIVATLDVVATELVERLAAPGQYQHARAGGQRRTTGKHDEGDDG